MRYFNLCGLILDTWGLLVQFCPMFGTSKMHPRRLARGGNVGGGPLASTNPKNLREHMDFDSFWVRSGEPSGIIENIQNLYILIISLVERRVWEAPGSLKHTWISLHFHYFFRGAESVGNSRIIKNTWISIYWHYLFGGAEGVGSSGIIENNHIFHTFSLILWWRGERGKFQNH